MVLGDSVSKTIIEYKCPKCGGVIQVDTTGQKTVIAPSCSVDGTAMVAISIRVGELGKKPPNMELPV